jgi:tetratricopeptide (TPR) repeat protein
MWKEICNFAVGMTIRRLFIGLFFVGTCLSAMAYNDHRNARVDSLEAALASKNPPRGDDLLRAYDELMRGYLPFDSAKAADYGRKALALSYERNGLNVRQNVLRHFAMMHYGREEFDEAIALYQKALAVVDTMATLKRYTEEVIDDAHSTIYGNLGNVYNLQDKGQLAIHYYQLALKIFEKYNWLESQSILYYNIGELYGVMGNEEEAMRNYLLAVEKGKASGDSLMVASPQKGLARLYLKQGNYEKARETAERCYAYYYAHRDKEEDYPTVLALMVRLNLMEGHEDIAAAKAYGKEALSLADGQGSENKREIYLACCELAMAEKQWKQALDYGLRSIHPDSLATSADAGCYQLLAEIYLELGEKEKAREYIQKMREVMNRYATDHYQSGLSQMEVLYETRQKEEKIAVLDKERGLYLWLLAAAIGLIALLIVLAVYRHLAHYWRQKLPRNTLILLSVKKVQRS